MIFNFKSTKDAETLQGHGADEFLQRSGGTMEAPYNIALVLKNIASLWSLLKHEDTTGVLGHLGFSEKDKPVFVNADATDYHELLHLGNMIKHAIAKVGGTAIRAINILEDETGTKPSTIVMTTNNGVSFLINNDTDGVRRQLSLSPRSSVADKNYCLALNTDESGQWETFSILHTGNVGDIPTVVGLREYLAISANSSSWKTNLIQFTNTAYFRNENGNDYHDISIESNGDFRCNSRIGDNFSSHLIHHDGNSAKVVINETAPSDTNALWVY